MKHIVTFSGGKDSLATICWAKDNLQDFEIVFCDTGWEHKKTYDHISEVEKWIGKPITYLKSDKFLDLIDLFIQKKRAASTRARFCTEELKTKPMIDYLLTLKEDVIVYQGVRAEESESRAQLKQNDEYFRYYFEPYGVDSKGKDKYHSYKSKAVKAHCDQYSVDVMRPILKWNHAEVFDYIFSHGLKPNPLYYEGFSRVGCFPCIMCRHDEIKLIAEKYSDRINEIRNLEKTMGRTFFKPGYIPERYCTIRVLTKKGKIVYCPSIDDVLNYVLDDKNQLNLFDKESGCISVYNICESPTTHSFDKHLR